MEKKIKNFRDLDVWKKGIEIVKVVYETVSNFPQRELYSLTNQMQRCSISISSNIAEGFNRFHNKQYRQFLYITPGSCAELETRIEIAKEPGYISQDKRTVLLEKLGHESRMLRNLIKKIR